MGDPFTRTRCECCGHDGSPHDVLVNIADNDEGEPVYVCESTRLCSDRMSERAALVPYTTGADYEDAP